MKKTLKNSEMDLMLRQLTPILSQRNRIGYAAARNYRILSESLIDYNRFKDELIDKYGEPDTAEDGTDLPTISIKIGSPNFKRFCDEMAVYNNISHEVELMVVKYEETIDILSGEEILAIGWMLED